MQSIAGHVQSLMSLDMSVPASGQHSTPPHANEREFVAALERMGLLSEGEVPAITPLTGGVSSDIVRANLRSGPICVKRALPKLKVTADWQAPVERNRWEVQWMKTAGAIAPDAVPRILGEDRESGMFAMHFLDEQDYPVWKLQLRDGSSILRLLPRWDAPSLSSMPILPASRPCTAVRHRSHFLSHSPRTLSECHCTRTSRPRRIARRTRTRHGFD